MELTKLSNLLGALVEQNNSGKGFQIHLNSGNLTVKNRNTSIEFGDIYFLRCRMLGKSLLCFDNSERKPVNYKEDGTPIYPSECNSNMFLDIANIEDIEEVENCQDWFEVPSSRVINVYMFPENDDMTRNVVTIGFME